MTVVKIQAGTMTASLEDRTVSGILLPFGEVGRTNVGRIMFASGVVEVPEDLSVVVGNTDHDRENPVAVATHVSETEAGFFSIWKIAKGEAGDALLAEIADKKNPDARRMLSAEVKGITTDSKGKALSGKLFGAAFVKQGAFPSATLFAADIGDETEETGPGLSPNDEGTITILATEYPEAVEVAGPTTDGAPASILYTPSTIAEPGDTTTMTAHRVHGQTTKTDKPAGLGVTGFFRLMAEAHRTRDTAALAKLHEESVAGSTMFAALSDIKAGPEAANANGGAVNAWQQPTWLGELWEGKSFERRIIPLFNHADLSALELSGWKWETRPTMGTWAGNKAQIPSAGIKTKTVKQTAKRLAGGHDIARELYDFPNPEFWEGYYKAMTESYAKLSDDGVFADVLKAAKYIAPGAVPTGVSAGMARIVDGALSMVDFALPSFALASKDVYREILLTRNDDTLAMLNAALGLEEGTVATFKVIPANLPTGTVLVGSGSAATVHELPGSPIRTEALDQARGGIDPALFGYYGTMVHDDRALTLVGATQASTDPRAA